MIPKKAPRVKKSSKSRFLAQPRTMLAHRAQTIGKTQKMSSNKSSNSEQSYSIQSRPGGLREALTIRPPPLLAKGSLGRAGSKTQFLLVFDPSKSLPGSSAQSANRASSTPFWSPFFQSLTDLTNLARIMTLCAPQAPKIIPKSRKKTLSKLFEKYLQKTTHF